MITSVKDIENGATDEILSLYYWERNGSNFLKRNPATRWLCVRCGRFLDVLNNEKQILKYLDNFKDSWNKKCKRCENCNAQNYFLVNIKEQRFIFLLKVAGKAQKVKKTIDIQT